MFFRLLRNCAVWRTYSKSERRKIYFVKSFVLKTRTPRKEVTYMAAGKFSRQRQAIVDYLMNTKEHPTADMVYANVKKLYPNVSLGTVYRNLNRLADEGQILRLGCVDGSERFDANIFPHYHFLCKDCRQIIDLPMESLHHIDILAGASFDGSIEGHSVLFFGQCKECQKRI